MLIGHILNSDKAYYREGFIIPNSEIKFFLKKVYPYISYVPTGNIPKDKLHVDFKYGFY